MTSNQAAGWDVTGSAYSTAARARHWALAAIALAAALSAAAVSARPMTTDPVSVICVEAETGLVVYEERADLVRPPASMIKLIMMLMVAEGLEAGRWTAETPILVSKHAESMGGTQVYVKAGDTWPLETMMQAISVASANDAAMAVAETLWGSESGYLEWANARARELGMNSSLFRSVHGLPPESGALPDQTTARDMSVLARACAAHPTVLSWTTRKEFQLRPNEAAKANTNKMLWRMENCDGLKTGFIRAAGFCVAATAVKDGVRIVTVLMGSQRSTERFAKVEEVMSAAFDRVRRIRVAERGQPIGEPVTVRNGVLPAVALTPAEDVWVTVKAEDAPYLEVWVDRPEALPAPIAVGSIVAELQVELRGELIAHAPLTIPQDVPAPTIQVSKNEHRTGRFARFFRRAGS